MSECKCSFNNGGACLAPSDLYKCGCFNLFKERLEKNTDAVIKKGVRDFYKRRKKKLPMTEEDQKETLLKIEHQRRKDE